MQLTLLQNRRIQIAIVIAGMILAYYFYTNVLSQAVPSAQRQTEVEPVRPKYKRYEAATFIPARIIVTKAMLKEVQLADADVPRAGPPQEWITDSGDVEGHISRQDIPAGMRLERGMIGEMAGAAGIAALVPPGRRAMTVQIVREAPQMLQYLVRPGDHVDIVANFKEDRYVKTVIQDIPVLAVDVFAAGRDPGTKDGVDMGNIAQHGPFLPVKEPPPGQQQQAPPPKPNKNTLTVGVTPEQADILALAAANSELDFVVRGRDDTPSWHSLLNNSRGIGLADISPFLGLKGKPTASSRPREKFVKLSLPPAPVHHSVTPVAPLPVPAPMLGKDSAPAAEKSKSGMHSIEVHSPGSVRMIEVPRDNEDNAPVKEPPRVRQQPLSPQPNKSTLGVRVTPVQPESSAVAAANGDLDFGARGRDGTSSLNSLLNNRHGKVLTDVSPYLAVPNEKPLSSSRPSRGQPRSEKNVPGVRVTLAHADGLALAGANADLEFVVRSREDRLHSLLNRRGEVLADVSPPLAIPNEKRTASGRGPAADKLKSDTHSIEVYSPGSARKIAVLQDNEDSGASHNMSFAISPWWRQEGESMLQMHCCVRPPRSLRWYAPAFALLPSLAFAAPTTYADRTPKSPLGERAVSFVPDVPMLDTKQAGVGASSRRDARMAESSVERIVVNVRLSKLLTMNGNITKIQFSNPEVIDAVPLATKYLSITGIKPGISSLIVFTSLRPEERVGVPKEYLVEVVQPTGPGDPSMPMAKAPEELQRDIESALQDPRITVRVSVDKDNKTLAVLRGNVEKERDAKNAERLANSFVTTVHAFINWTIPDVAPAQPGPPSADEILTRELQEETGLTTFRARKAGMSIILFGEVPTLDDQATVIRLARARGPVIATSLKVTNAVVPVPTTGARTMSNNSIALMEADLSDAEQALTDRVRSITRAPNIIVRQQEGRFFLLGRVKNQQEYDRVKQALEFLAGFRGAAVGAVGGALGGQYPIANFVEIEEGGVIRKINIQAYIVEINKSATKDLGITWGGLTSQSVQQSGGGISGLSPLSGVSPVAGQITLGQNPTGSGGFQRFDPIIGQLRALQSRSLARILSSPNETTLDRAPAWIQVGGSFPIVTTTLAGGGLATQTVSFVAFGIILTFRPEVTDDRQVILQIHSEVSQPDFANAVTFQGARIPGIRQRAAETRIPLRPGETGVIGGLIDRNDSKGVTGIPILSKIPVLGALFTSRSFQKGETELMIFVTPTVEEVPASSGAMSAAERSILLPQLPTPNAIGTTTATPAVR